IVGQNRSNHDVAADDELARIALCRVDELGQADRAARAGYIGHLHAWRNAFVLQRLLHGTRGLVPAAARAGRRHDLVVGRECLAGKGEATGREGGENDPAHGLPPVLFTAVARGGSFAARLRAAAAVARTSVAPLAQLSRWRGELVNIA